MAKQVDEAFYDCIINGGTLVATCSICGVTHYAEESIDFHEDELEQLKEKEKLNPSKFKSHQSDSIDVGEFDGKTIIYGCCEDWLRVQQNKIVRNRIIILTYLKKRNEAISAMLNKEKNLLNTYDDIPEEIPPIVDEYW